MQDDGGLTRRALLRAASRTGLGVAALASDPALSTVIADPGRRTLASRRKPRRQALTFGTELEYYRSDPSHLEARLRLMQQAGYSTVQTYVPWNVHENTRGALDFRGRTSPVIVSIHFDEYQIETPDQEVAAGGLFSRVLANTNLLGFLEACARHGFDVILRPGPFISDEWRNGGLPDWLALVYPDMFMRGPHGSALEPGFPFSPPTGVITGGGPLFYFAGPSYASRDYLRESRRWMTEFARVVRPYLRSRGGPIVSMQVDDEICFYYRFGPFEVDYHPEMVARFGETPPTDWPAQGGPPRALRPALRWQRFKAEQLAVWLREMTSALRAGGVDVPITHEEELQLAPPANFSRLAKAVDVLHPEFYLDAGAYSRPTIELCAAAIRASQRQLKSAVAAEMSEDDVFVRHLLLGEGVTGFLGFSYTTGIDAGSVAAMSVLGRALRFAGQRIQQSDRAVDAAIVWPTEYLYAPYHSTAYGFARDLRNIIESDVPALATLLIRAGLAFDLLDTDVAGPDDYRRYRSIWLACGDVLERSCQRALVSYVRAGGRLICWPAPPTLDENYGRFTLLRDALYNQPLGPFKAGDGQTITVLGTKIEAWRGVQSFRLRGAAPIAYQGHRPCGYLRRIGRGHALLLGTWPVADSIPGRMGDVLQSVDVSGSSLDIPRPAGAGRPQTVLVFDYPNQRRGGEVITGGAVTYWDGENVVPLTGVNLANTLPGLQLSRVELANPPFRPIKSSHVKAAQLLHGQPPLLEVSDTRIQARLLRARHSAGAGAEKQAATISLVNRFDSDISFFLRTHHPDEHRRLPLQGTMTLPGRTALLAPLEYELAPRLVVEQATLQLLDAALLGRSAVDLSVTSPAGGELVLQLPGTLRQARVDGGPAPASHNRGYAKVAVPAGEHRVQVAWR